MLAARAEAASWRWLASTKELQEQAYGYDFRVMRKSARAICDYLTHMVFAAINELVEASYEFEWKHWTREAAWYDRDLIVSEMVDTVHMIGNICVALGVDDDEWAALYRAKQAKNRERMAAKYTSRRDKPSAAR